MTREEILKLEPGPELDRLIAERVMEWKEGQKTLQSLECGIGILGEKALPRYSTDIAAAMKVVQKLLETRLRISMYSPWKNRDEPHAMPEWTVFCPG